MLKDNFIVTVVLYVKNTYCLYSSLFREQSLLLRNQGPDLAQTVFHTRLRSCRYTHHSDWPFHRVLLHPAYDGGARAKSCPQSDASLPNNRTNGDVIKRQIGHHGSEILGMAGTVADVPCVLPDTYRLQGPPAALVLQGEGRGGLRDRSHATHLRS